MLMMMPGLEFDATPFPDYMQFIDRPLLEDRLLESIWYAHAHPPLLNLLVGVGLKLPGDPYALLAAIVFHGLGLLMIVCLFAVCLRLTGSRVAAYAAAALILLNPAFTLYENWLLYTFPAAALLGISAYALLRSLDDEGSRWLYGLFALLAALALLRSLFHLVWLACILAMLLLLLKERRRTILVSAALPLLLTAGWYAKNLVYYGTFSASSMLGLGLSNISTLTFRQDELAPLVIDGHLSPFALVSRYTDTEILFTADVPEPTGIEVLDTTRKSSGAWNYNSRGLLDVSEHYRHDAMSLIRLHPANYVTGLILANRLYFSPTSMNEYFSPANREALAPVENIYNPLVLGAHADPRYMIQPHFGFDREPSLEVNTSLRLILLTVVLLAFGYARFRRAFVSDDPESRVTGIIIGFIACNILYVWLVGTAVELGENFRYRFLAEPLFFVLLVVGAHAAWQRVRPLLEPIHSVRRFVFRGERKENPDAQANLAAIRGPD